MKGLRETIEKESVLIILGGLLIVSLLIIPGFATVDNFKNILVQSGVLGAIALGEALVLLSGNLDLTPGSVVALCSVVTATFMKYSMFAGIIAGIGVCVLIGTASGYMVSKAKMPSLLVTLGMMGIARSAAMVISAGKSVTGVEERFQQLSNGLVAGIPVPFLLVLLGTIVMAFLLKSTRWGRGIYATGGNEHSAFFSGIRTDKIKLQVFITASAFYALAGLIYTSRISSGTPEGGVGYELDAITAAVLGGIHLMGGKGKIRNVIAGTLILAVISNLMNLQGISPYSQQVVKGFLFIIIVSSRGLLQKRATKKLMSTGQ